MQAFLVTNLVIDYFTLDETGGAEVRFSVFYYYNSLASYLLN